MSAKQCNKCGRFKGAGTHVCATLSKKVLTPKAPTTAPSISQRDIPVVASSAPSRPNPEKVAAILADTTRLNNTIKALEIAMNSKTKNLDLRLKLEATFGKIDWNA